MQKSVDTLIVIPNQNLFRVANEKTTFADAFAMADQVLYSGVACITDLMVKEGLINLDFADVRSIMGEMGKAMMGTGEASGEKRAVMAAEAAIANPLLDETSMKGARGLLISITGGADLTLYEVDEAASRIRQEVDEEANIILGATFDAALDGVVRVSVVATGIDKAAIEKIEPIAQAARAEIPSRAALAPRLGRRRRRSPRNAWSRSKPALPAAIARVDAGRSRSPSGRAQAGGVRGACRAASRRADRGGVHAPGAGTTDDPPAAHAADRGAAASRARLSFARIAAKRRLPLIPPKRGGVRCWKNSPLSASAGMKKKRRRAPRAMPPALPAAPRPSRARAALHAEYGRPQPRPATPRPAQGNLDAHGRIAARAAQMEDDQLEIPAFLRRQSNYEFVAPRPPTAAAQPPRPFRVARTSSRPSAPGLEFKSLSPLHRNMVYEICNDR